MSLAAVQVRLRPCQKCLSLPLIAEANRLGLGNVLTRAKTFRSKLGGSGFATHDRV